MLVCSTRYSYAREYLAFYCFVKTYCMEYMGLLMTSYSAVVGNKLAEQGPHLQKKS